MQPFSETNPEQFLILFPFLFAGMWLFITTTLGFLSGWFRLQQQFDRIDDAPLRTLRGRSGSMGPGVALNGILTLSASPVGVRVGIWRVFGPFQRPFLVPWNEIQAEPTRSLFAPSVRLRFGRPQVGKLTIDARTWQKLTQGIAQAPVAHATLVSRQAAGVPALLLWGLSASGAAIFFYFGSRSVPGSPGLPLTLCIGFPAAVFGFQAIRYYFRELH